MSVQFTAQETSKVPAGLRPLMQKYPLAFDNLLDVISKKEIPGTIQSLDIYFDDQLLPALSFSKEQQQVQVMSRVSPDDPKVLTVFANDECGYVQIEDRVLLNRIGDEFLEVFEI
jgi:hypothetical protein